MYLNFKVATSDEALSSAIINCQKIALLGSVLAALNPGDVAISPPFDKKHYRAFG